MGRHTNDRSHVYVSCHSAEGTGDGQAYNDTMFMYIDMTEDRSNLVPKAALSRWGVE